MLSAKLGAILSRARLKIMHFHFPSMWSLPFLMGMIIQLSQLQHIWYDMIYDMIYDMMWCDVMWYPLFFIIVLEALSRDLRVGVPWELFFADDLVIIAASLEECVERVKAWKAGLESKGLHVNMTKTKFMASGLGLDILQDSGKFPYAVCRTGVGRSSMRYSKCNLWVYYKKCSGLKTLSEDMSYECPHCRGEPGVRPIDGRPFKEVEVGDCVLEAVNRFCYLGDMLSAGGGCMAAATARCRCAWGKFRENLPLLTPKPVPFDLMVSSV